MRKSKDILTSLREPLLVFAKAVFHFYGFLWILRRKKAYSMTDVLKLFYIDFLKIDEKYIEVIRLNDELITRCRNPCPILKLSERLKLDTKHVCREVSEPVCRFVLKNLNPNLMFERNYEHIRPYAESCEERIYWKRRDRVQGFLVE